MPDNNFYGNRITWYLDDVTQTVNFFDRVVGISGSYEYDDITSFNSLRRYWQEYVKYSVELLSPDRIVLTVELLGVTFSPASIALISNVERNGNVYEKLVGKITISQDIRISNQSYTRVFNIQVPPVKELNGRKILPRFKTSFKRDSNPVGGEFVLVGEHHHSVANPKTSRIDSFPTLPESQSNRMISSQLFEMDMSTYQNGESHSMTEMGSRIYPLEDFTGQLTNEVNGFSGMRDRSMTDSSILANVLEVLIMASNSIQIFGKQIPTQSAEETFASLRDSTYFLLSDKVEASDDRNLKAVKYSEFTKIVTSRYTVSGSTLTVNSVVNFVETDRDCTITVGSTPSMVFVGNTKTFSNLSTYRGNTVTVNEVSIPPRSMAVFYFDGSSTSSFVMGESEKEYLEKVLDGTIAFSKVSVKNGGGDGATYGLTMGDDGVLEILGPAKMRGSLDMSGQGIVNIGSFTGVGNINLTGDIYASRVFVSGAGIAPSSSNVTGITKSGDRMKVIAGSGSSAGIESNGFYVG